jgi:hypothetical protein
MKRTRLVVPPVDRLAKARAGGQKYQAVTRSIRPDSNRFPRETPPATCNLGLTQDVIGSAGDTLPIAIVENGMKLPRISSRLDLTAVLAHQPLHKRFRQ